MKDTKLNSKIEVFVCNHHREDKENCFDKGSKELTDQLRRWAKEKTNKEVRIFRSGCLGKCEEGIAMACFPMKTMTTEINLNDYEKIKEGLKEALE